jgi:hypothetical protein
MVRENGALRLATWDEAQGATGPRGRDFNSYDVDLYPGSPGKVSGVVKLRGGAVNGAKIVEAPSEGGSHVLLAASVEDVAKRWAKQFWSAYSGSLTPQLALCHALSAKTPYGTGVPGARTLHEERVLVEMLGQLVAGFCIGGYVRSDRRPAAFEVIFYPMGGEPTPVACRPGHSLWGIPAFVLRLITGCAEEVRQAILASGKWQGTESELNAIILQHCLAHPPTVPIREAIDFVHTCLLTTIKAMKFSQHAQRCGGPIEIAVMTTDRPFRWVLHKTWDSAIREGEPHDARVIPNTAGGWAATNW